MTYYFNKIMTGNFDEIVLKVTEALKKEGFGVLTTINIQEKLKEKLGVDFRKYVILGSCHPPSAYEALKAEDKIGLMLPCNVIVQETEGGKVEVAAIDPIASMQAIENPRLGSVAESVREKLKNVIDRL